jgi:hypothetical protein
VKPGVRRSVAVTAVTAVLATVAVLVPQITGALNLTTTGKILSVLAVGLLTASGQRLAKCVNDRQAEKDALRVWPPEPLGAARIETLGVFPVRGPKGWVAKYQPRPSGEDDALAVALRQSKNVIVHGPPSCGKTRAISQAARHALANTPAVIPLDSQSLRSLLDDGVRLKVPQKQLCLWLDGLDRFIDALDPRSLTSLNETSKVEIGVVGTIRTRRWEELIGGSGQPSEAARALAGEAQIVQLSGFSPQTPGEPDAATPAVTPAKPRGPWRDAILGLLVFALVAVIVLGRLIGGALFNPPSISDQMDKLKSRIVASAGPGGGHVVVDERVQFHSTEQPSWLLVVEDLQSHEKFTEGAADGRKPLPRSDDLRIYDVVNGELREELHFQPRGIGEKAAEWRILQAGATPSADYDQDGSPEVVAGYARPSQATEALLPFGIDWGDDGYELVPLTSTKPGLGSRGLDARTIGYRREAYETPITLRNAVNDPRFSGLKLKGYRVQTFALAQRPSPRLLTGYFSAYPVFAQTQVLEIHANQLRTSQLRIAPCRPSYYACPAPRAQQDVLVPPDKALDNALLEAWGMVGNRWDTPVRVVEHQR